MHLETISTHHVPVSVFTGGKGRPLVFLHGAGGLTADDPFMAALATRYHVHAPLLPGYGASEECEALRDMLDVTLHTVKRHMEHILRKLGVDNRQKAIKAVADRLGA